MRDKWQVVLLSRHKKVEVLSTHWWQWSAMAWALVFSLAYDNYMTGAVDVWKLSD